MWMMLHGFTGSPESWNAVIEHADLDDELLVPALLGHESGGPAARAASFDEEVSRLAALASALQPPRLLCGYSLGARVGLALLAERPGLFDAAILIGVHPGLEDDAARSERRATDAGRARVLRAEGLDAFVAAWEELPLFLSQRDLPSETLERQRAIRSSHDAEGLARSLEVLGLAEMPSYGAALSATEIPITLMAGSRDAKFADLARALCDRNPCLEPAIVDGVGHNVLLEAPESVAAVLECAERRAKEGAS